MVKIAMLVFIGGCLGCHASRVHNDVGAEADGQFSIGYFPRCQSRGPPFLLGLVTALHRRQVVSEGAEMLLGTGFAGGLSTFSSFAYGALVPMSASMASAAIRVSLCRDQSGAGLCRSFVAGLKLGGRGS